MRLGAMDVGGSHVVCAVGNERGRVVERSVIPTREPEETIADVTAFFHGRRIDALGIGCFGPLDLDPRSRHYGTITNTPKRGWENFPMRTVMLDALDLPVGIDTNGNAAALAEGRLGAGAGVHSLVYYSVGMGIGGGAVVKGGLIRGLIHPEMGHMLLRPDPRDPTPQGFCPYHEGCLEGLASAAAMEKRWGTAPEGLPADHVGWDIEAEYLAQMCVNTIVMLSPERVVLGGEVMHRRELFPEIRRLTLKKLNGYVAHRAVMDDTDNYIVPPALGDDAVIAGALLLSFDALKNQ